MPFLSFLRPKAKQKPPLLERCLSVDLEVDPKKAEIFEMAAARCGSGPAVVAGKGMLQQSLDKLEASLKTTSYIIGHNILRHDIEHLLAKRPRLRDKMMSPINTLWLNPLAIDFQRELTDEILRTPKLP
jgi:ATP-dependent DNA helicase RecQ